MDNDSPPMRRQWLPAQSPFGFGLTPEGALWIEFDLGGQGPAIHSGIQIPAEELLSLRKGLELTKTIQETLSVKSPKSGPH